MRWSGTWLKQEGDAVSRGESLVELETDKVNLDVTAEEDGVLESIARREGDVVTVGEVLGLVGAGNGASAPAPAPHRRPPRRPQPPAAPAPASAEPPPIAASAPPPAPATTPVRRRGLRPIWKTPTALGAGAPRPAVRRLAEEHHIDLNAVTGTGPGGRVTREDVLIVAARQAVQATPTAPAAAPIPAQPHVPDAPPASPPTPAQRPTRPRQRRLPRPSATPTAARSAAASPAAARRSPTGWSRRSRRRRC